MINKKAFTLVEMLITLIVAAILVLTMGVLSDLAMSTTTKLRRETEIYNEVLHGYKIMQKHMREASSCAMITPSSVSWIGDIVECPATPGVEGIAFGVWDNAGDRQLVFLEDKLDDTNREVIVEVPSNNAFPNNTLTIGGTLNPGYLDVTIQGSKGVASRNNNVDEIPFQLNTKIKFR